MHVLSSVSAHSHPVILFLLLHQGSGCGSLTRWVLSDCCELANRGIAKNEDWGTE
jgi:hypothetical protein